MKEEWCLNCFCIKGDYEVCPYCGYRDGEGPQKECQLSPGTVLKKRFIVGRVLGQGGFGIIYLAFDTVLGARVALKECFPAGIVNRAAHSLRVQPLGGEKKEAWKRAKKNFLQSARYLAGLTDVYQAMHVNCYFEANGTAYLMMEYIEGKSLAQLLEEREKVGEAEALSVICAVLEGLWRIEKKGLIHGDLSPGNVMVTGRGRIKLIDFGAACKIDDVMGQQTVRDGYSPPELYGEPKQAKSQIDVYSAGAILFEMLTNMHPPKALDRFEKSGDLDAYMEKAGVSGWLGGIIKKSMELSWQKRYEDAGQMLEAIQRERKAHNQGEKRGGESSHSRGKKNIWEKFWTFLMAAVCIALSGSILLAVLKGEMRAKAEVEISVPEEVDHE